MAYNMCSIPVFVYILLHISSTPSQLSDVGSVEIYVRVVAAIPLAMAVAMDVPELRVISGNCP